MSDLWDRIESRIHRLPESGCWVFMGATTSRGYGHLGGPRGTPNVLAHRASFERHHRALSPGEFVCHICDVKCCVNPHHLYAGSRFDNARDAAVRRRFAYGLRNGNGKLTQQDVRDIRAMLFRKMPVAQIARAFAVVPRTVFDIRDGLIHKEPAAAPHEPEGGV